MLDTGQTTTVNIYFRTSGLNLFLVIINRIVQQSVYRLIFRQVTTTIDGLDVVCVCIFVCFVSDIVSINFLCRINIHLNLTLWCTIQIITAEDAVHGASLSVFIHTTIRLLDIIQFNQHIAINHSLNGGYT